MRGILFLTRNHVCFHHESTTTDATISSPPANRDNKVSISFKDITGIELVPPKRVFGPEGIQISIVGRVFVFSMMFGRKEAYQALCHLSNVAMQRLVKANNEIEPIKGMNGELSESYRTPSVTMSTADSLTRRHSISLFSNKKPPEIAKTVEEMDELKRNAHFRNLFRFPMAETLLEAHVCTFWNKATQTSHAGRIYTSTHFLSFVSSSNSSSSSVGNPGSLSYGNGAIVCT